ncbi:hypothetical protein [uncultured Thiodictyon sp.]|uniref:hypothetical protein n=1 Tax=uncultured Thiodictyon sp. TaxID=1846217 RepID=UPI0025D92B0D|nr:hypothetical protein [uncultured Thiodictyon sp.]
MGFFFTLLDDSLRPKGSRDPLGIEHVWSQVGRRLVGNLTTVTGHLDNFILALLGFHLAQAEPDVPPGWPAFQRFEQIAARARKLRGHQGIRGDRLARLDGRGPVPLGEGRQAAILQDAVRSGLWGLYASPLAATGLCQYDRRPCGAGAEIAEQFRMALRPCWSTWLQEAMSADQVSYDDLAALAPKLERLLDAPAPRRRLAEILLDGGDAPPPWQGPLLERATAFVARGGTLTTPAVFEHLAEGDDPLADYARRVIALESLLVLARVLFNYLLGCRDRPLADLSRGLTVLEARSDRTGLLFPEFPEITNRAWLERRRGLCKFADAARERRWTDAVRTLLEHHAGVMRARGTPAWAFLDGERLKVLMGSGSDLRAEDRVGWDNGYFVTPLLAILEQSRRPMDRQA